MNDFLSSFLNKITKKVSRRKTTKWNKNQIKLDLLKLEERLVPAPNLVVLTTISGAPKSFELRILIKHVFFNQIMGIAL